MGCSIHQGVHCLWIFTKGVQYLIRDLHQGVPYLFKDPHKYLVMKSHQIVSTRILDPY